MQVPSKAAAAAVLAGGLFIASSIIGSSVAPTLTAVASVAASSRSLPASERTVAVPNRTAQADAFLNAAALSASSMPGQMEGVLSGPVTLDVVTAALGSDASSTLSSLGFVEGYEQAFRTSNPLAALTGSPAGAGDTILVFSDATGASSWNQFETQNVTSIGLQSAGAQGVDINLTSSQPIAFPSFGDESSATELQGTATISGQTLNVYVDLAFMRRDRVQYTAIVVGLQSQQSALVTLAQALDSSVASALPLLGS